MTTLTDFLLLRIAEDEEWARVELCRWPGGPARLLAECEAKRRIVEEHAGDHECPSGQFAAWFGGDCPTLCLLASVYADHPDYREEWRP